MIGISANFGILNTIGGLQSLIAVSGNRLATGQRITAGRDDPAGLIASENLEAELAALEAENRALERNDSVARTAEAALAEVSGMLVEGEGLAVAAANTGGMSDAELNAIQLEMDSINQSAERAFRTATFGGRPLFNGELTVPSGRGGQSLDLGLLSVSTLGSVEIDGRVYSLRDTSSGEPLALNNGRGGDAQRVISAGRSSIATLRGELGAFQRNAIGSRRAAIGAGTENLSRANSLIRDADFWAESANNTRLQTLARGSFAVLGLANSNRENVFIALAVGSRRL